MEIDQVNANWLRETLPNIIESIRDGAKRIEYAHTSENPMSPNETVEVTAYKLTENQIRIDIKRSRND